ncbi:sulfotransferase [Psychromonas sp. PT13]|uniref:sulfotransferase n=1 Tax=Psychromonas sp. PT13 TaxID=3439547 RepID=UPI003EB797AD
MKDVLVRPIIFIGVPRSGTTIIAETILSNNTLAWPSNYSDRFPKLVSLNVLRRFFQNKYIDIHGNKSQLHKVGILNKYAFKADESYPMWDYLIGEEFSKGVINREATEIEKKSIRRYFSSLVRKQGKERLAFKITGPSRIKFLQSIFPDACFIRVKRKSIPTISSLMNVDFWKNGGANNIWWNGLVDSKNEKKINGIKNSQLQLTAYQVYKLNELTLKEIKVTKANIIELNYENFLTNPDSEIQRICVFCGLGFSIEIKKYLTCNPLINRNKEDTEYFSQKELEQIKNIKAFI